MDLKGWKNIELSKLFEFKNGLNAGKESYGTGVKFINVMEVIYNSHITEDKIKGSVVLQNGQLEAYLVKKGDVLFNRTSETQEEIALAAVYLDDVPVVFGGFVIRARPLNDWLDNDFKKYCFFSRDFREQVIERGQGGIRTNIGQSDLEKVKLLTPPPSEQKYIAKVLSAWDKSIETLTQLIAAKQQLKKGLMQQLLTGKKRLPGFKGEWHTVALSKVAEIDRLSLNSQTPENYQFQYLSLSDVEEGSAAINSEKIYFKDAPSRARRIVNRGDVLISTVRPNLQGFLLVKDEVKDLVASTGFAVVTCIKIHNEFLYQYLFSRDFMKQIEALLVGSNYPAINSSDVANLRIPYPMLDEQIAIASILAAADNEIIVLKGQLEKFRHQKQGLMQQLLTGKKRVKV